jgi:hypothetical protein
MRSSDWLSVFQRLPESQHADLILVTSVGMEIMVQKIVRLEEDYVVLRGRLAGSTELGRVVVLPFDQINHLAINKPLLEHQIRAIFDPTAEAPPAESAENTAAEPSAAVVDNGPVPTAAPEPAAAQEPPVDANKNGKASPPSKSLLLARLRARLADKKSSS